MATFDRNQIKEYLSGVEDDCAEFIGAEFCGARLVGNISRQYEQGDLDEARATQLLDDAHHLMRLAKMGHRYVKLARNPSPEIRTMVLADYERERKYA
jgi:hypothetical protein